MLQNTHQDAYIDSSISHQRSSRPLQTPQRTISPTASSEATTKPRPIEPPAYTDAPYLDNPPLPYHNNSPSSLNTPCSQLQQQRLVFHISTPSDHRLFRTSSRPSNSSEDEDDDDVPLAHLLYSLDAPPAYSTVVRQSYRETLLQHTPGYHVVTDTDEEAAMERIHEDEVRFTIERAVAMAVVIALLVLAGILFGLLFLRN
ncbi:hypothetical protein SVAN01_02656 [Stagonosporopsis vannaccii]|nr:hypothetical protein SVAN01_02656 [Stagonosporopsis vannaccii]